jgi:hypothetical protein
MIPTQEIVAFVFSVKYISIFLAFFSATMLFAYRCEKHPRFRFRLGLMLVFLFIVWRIFTVTDGGDLWTEVIYSATLIVIMIAGLNFCYTNSFWTILFYFGSGFMTWYIADRTIIVVASLCSQIPALAGYFVENTISHIFLYWATFVVVYLLIYSTIGRQMRQLGGSEIPATNAIMLFLVVCILTPIFYFESDWVAHYNLFYYTLLNVGEIIYYVSMLLVQIVMLGSAKEKSEFTMLKKLWLEEQKQYKLVKENIEAINIKCHDLKHQIRHLRETNQVDAKYLDEMEKSISIYNSAVRTGNETLDVILTDKRLHCTTNGIQFTCIAEGSKMDFMEPMDIFSLFGNALDNAIECTEKLAPEKRFIHLSIRATNQLLLIHIENPFEGKLIWQDGIPATTKNDRDYHGYGMRSMKHIIRKYGGDLSIRTDDMLFQLNIMIPIPNAK